LLGNLHVENSFICGGGCGREGAEGAEVVGGRYLVHRYQVSAARLVLF